MASHEKILEFIDQKRIDRLIPIVLDSDNYRDNEGLKVRLWDTFLPPSSIDDAMHELSDTTIEQLEKDIARSFHHFKDIPPERHAKLREKLLKLMTRIFEHPYYRDSDENEAELHYYQSFHDIAALMVLKFGYKNGLSFLERLCRSHLRDFMDADFSHTTAFSAFVIEIVKRLDREAAAKLESIRIPPFFFISWCLAWFSHDMELSTEVSPIFDVLLMLPPSAIGYASAVLIQRGRDAILSYESELGSDEFGHLHQGLKTLPKDSWSQSVLLEVHQLMLRYPPSTIIKNIPILQGSSFDQDVPARTAMVTPNRLMLVGIPFTVLLIAILFKAFQSTPISHADFI